MTIMTALQVLSDGWTIDDLDELSDEDAKRCELVDGALLVTPPPELRHDYAVAQLVVLLSVVTDPWCLVAGGGVRFDLRNYRQPDVQVVNRAALGKKQAAPGDVPLVVEVMSPRTVSTDRVSKPQQYAEAGIPHFWRLEPADRVLVTYALDGAAYRETGRFTDDVAIEQPVRLRFELSTLLD